MSVSTSWRFVKCETIFSVIVHVTACQAATRRSFLSHRSAINTMETDNVCVRAQVQVQTNSSDSFRNLFFSSVNENMQLWVSVNEKSQNWGSFISTCSFLLACCDRLSMLVAHRAFFYCRRFLFLSPHDFLVLFPSSVVSALRIFPFFSRFLSILPNLSFDFEDRSDRFLLISHFLCPFSLRFLRLFPFHLFVHSVSLALFVGRALQFAARFD